MPKTLPPHCVPILRVRDAQASADYYHADRTHLGLDKDTPEGREPEPPEVGKVIALSRVGGLHHRYTRRAA